MNFIFFIIKIYKYFDFFIFYDKIIIKITEEKLMNIRKKFKFNLSVFIVLVDFAVGKDKSAGIAVTCRLWDATPADFCCHNKDRDAEAEIVAV